MFSFADGMLQLPEPSSALLETFDYTDELAHHFEVLCCCCVAVQTPPSLPPRPLPTSARSSSSSSSSSSWVSVSAGGTRSPPEQADAGLVPTQGPHQDRMLDRALPPRYLCKGAAFCSSSPPAPARLSRLQLARLVGSCLPPPTSASSQSSPPLPSLGNQAVMRVISYMEVLKDVLLGLGFYEV
eukprot:767845-Hanusia_phi.AAC.3